MFARTCGSPCPSAFSRRFPSSTREPKPSALIRKGVANLAIDMVNYFERFRCFSCSYGFRRCLGRIRILPGQCICICLSLKFFGHLWIAMLTIVFFERCLLVRLASHCIALLLIDCVRCHAKHTLHACFYFHRAQYSGSGADVLRVSFAWRSVSKQSPPFFHQAGRNLTSRDHRWGTIW